MNKAIGAALIAMLALCVYAGASMRLYNAETRAAHADEGEQTFTFARLFIDGEYKYNANGPHGPILYYYADAAMRGSDPGSFEIKDLRKTLLPVWALTLLLLLASPALSRDTAPNPKLSAAPPAGFASGAFACALLCFSALSQIYSTYFVQECFFALFSLACAMAAFSFIKRPSFLAAAALGVSAGLLQCAKETSVIVFASAAAGAAAAMLAGPFRASAADAFRAAGAKRYAAMLAAAAACALAVYAAFYSSFGSNWQGLADGLKSYAHFFEKSGSDAHSKGFLYYFTLLAGQRSQGPLFGETAIFALSIAGFFLAALRRNAFVVFASVFAWVNVLVLSLISYKTPWLMLAPVTAMCIPAGYAASSLAFPRVRGAGRLANCAASAAGILLLGWLFSVQYSEARAASRNYPSDPRNPFIYVHTLRDSERLVKRIKACAKAAGPGFRALVLTKNSPWPLPWQLIRVGGVEFSSDASAAAAPGKFTMIVYDAPFDADMDGRFDDDEWLEEFFGLRENLLLRSRVRRGVFEKSIERPL